MARTLLIFAISLLFHPALQAQVFDEKFDVWPLQTTIIGTVVVAPQLNDLSVLKEAFRRLDEEVTVGLLTGSDVKAQDAAAMVEVFDRTRVKVQAVSPDSGIVETLSEWTESCDVICLHTNRDTPNPLLEKAVAGLAGEFRGFVRRRNRLVLVGSIAQLAGKTKLVEPSSPAPGFDFLPDAVMAKQAVSREALTKQLSANPGMVGVVVQPNTALVLGGRVARVIGTGSAEFMLPAGRYHQERTKVLRQPERRQRPPEFLVDWTEWRRDSIDRSLPLFPPELRQKPFVKSGTLLIVGGGGTPKGLMDRFVELAGGPEDAKLVYVPCSEDQSVSPRQRMVSAWKQMGVKSATFIHTKDRTKANTDEEFLAPLNEATGIWFGGGRQWNMADSYYGTEAHRLMKNVLNRGGVIGGSSAGASIQARYLARATPIENFRIMAPGYERGGLGFISGVAIDQHFSQRGRQEDMTQLVDRYPQLLGIGLDEATAIEVHQSTAKVTGRGKVFFYDRNRPVVEGEPDYVSLPSGSSYDLARRSIVLDAINVDEDTGEHSRQ